MPKAGAYAVRESVHQEVQPIGAPCTPHSRWDPGKRCMGYALWGPGCSLRRIDGRQFLGAKQSMKLAFRGHSKKWYLWWCRTCLPMREFRNVYVQETDALVHTCITL